MQNNHNLTDREIKLLKLLYEKLNTNEIAKRLSISPKTVDFHKSKLLEKIGVKNTIGLIIYAIQNGIVDVD